MLAGVLPLPEDMDELAFAGFLRGAPTPTIRLGNGVEVPANAEIILEGEVPAAERREEGPFGDHFGHYSHAAPFPVFHVKKIHRRKGAIYPAAVVGKPPQEDKYLGNAVQDMLLPLLKLMKPEIEDLWAYFEAGFHNLAAVSVRQRYAKEGVKTALGLLGEGQMSLTKCVVLVDPDVNARRFTDVLSALRRDFDPREDFILLPGTAQDTLDFTSFKMNLGSKMILDATSFGKERRPRPDLPPVDIREPGVISYRNWNDALLAVRVKSDGRGVLERLLKDRRLAGFPLIAAVSEDVPLDDDELLLWGIFTRFDCARDVIPAAVELAGAWPRYQGPLGVDATWKPGYPEPLVMDPAVVDRVDRRWSEYRI
jgi:4-hydroxy-3-polyprenylbenzoate decarboxylase